MDVTKILAALREEREHVDEAIASLESLAQGRGRRRGRPPTYLANKPPHDPDDSGGTPSEGAAGLPVPRSLRGSRRPPRITKAGAALKMEKPPLADGIARRRK